MNKYQELNAYIHSLYMTKYNINEKPEDINFYYYYKNTKSGFNLNIRTPDIRVPDIIEKAFMFWSERQKFFIQSLDSFETYLLISIFKDSTKLLSILEITMLTDIIKRAPKLPIKLYIRDTKIFKDNFKISNLDFKWEQNISGILKETDHILCLNIENMFKLSDILHLDFDPNL